MPIMVVTRLRLQNPGVLDAFFTAAVAVLEQAKKSPGSLGADALAEAHDTWWTVTAWADRAAMEAFVRAEPHRATMARLDDWCDEATFADWEQAGPELPDWPTSYRHIVAEGTSASLRHPSAEQHDRKFPPPVLPAQPAGGS
jgi:heme-degrading monooxygenase HmoA